jgi:hypothetical protein
VVDPAVLKDGDVPADAVVRGLCKILPMVLPRYSDAESRSVDKVKIYTKHNFL